ncbi:hypothetical protein, partial [Pararhodobacter sp.]|uniref:hypothetical protein n=1 Tax=Pararhodobacter sp. TaxID=2127056 RepID=UPI002FDDA4B5
FSPPPGPDTDTSQTSDQAEAARRLARALRNLPRGALDDDLDEVTLLARRIDTLLDRMSDASGAGRW